MRKRGVISEKAPQSTEILRPETALQACDDRQKRYAAKAKSCHRKQDDGSEARVHGGGAAPRQSTTKHGPFWYEDDVCEVASSAPNGDSCRRAHKKAENKAKGAQTRYMQLMTG